ncbi:hypothetical protein QQF64_021365 [Cirrhinus molitorella]|uniref:Uncharacterized protein n=1 Tax=Cirrhinus molitorella TaxID=172907 RepID=A0ABR3LD94_9TELE
MVDEGSAGRAAFMIALVRRLRNRHLHAADFGRGSAEPESKGGAQITCISHGLCNEARKREVGQGARVSFGGRNTGRVFQATRAARGEHEMMPYEGDE